MFCRSSLCLGATMPFRASNAPCALTTSVLVLSENCGPSFGGLCTTTETFKSIRRLRRLFNRIVSLPRFCPSIQNQDKTPSPVPGQIWHRGFQAGTTGHVVRFRAELPQLLIGREFAPLGKLPPFSTLTRPFHGRSYFGPPLLSGKFTATISCRFANCCSSRVSSSSRPFSCPDAQTSARK
jgi:hypothetical protein